MTDQSTRPFSWLAFIGGLVATLAVGAFLNLASGLTVMAVNLQHVGFLIGALPGALIIFFAARSKRLQPGFMNGVLLGGCIVALVGGACGAQLGGF